MRNFSMIMLCSLAMLLLLPSIAFGECTCEAEQKEERNISLALKLKVGAIASILVAAAIGVCMPVAGRRLPALSPDNNIFFVVKASAAGVILSTGFVHVLPDAFENLKLPCITVSPWGDFPLAGFIAMISAVGTLLVDTYATNYYRRRMKAAEGDGGDQESGLPVHTHGTHGHAHGSLPPQGKSEVRRHRVVAHVLELGIVLHSVIIGIALGASQSPQAIKPLIAALTFHQFFEGIGLGGCITQAKFHLWATAVMATLFSITTPTGIAVGIGISHIYSETSLGALMIEGVLNAASAGILIYMALVDLLSTDFMSSQMQNHGMLQLGASISLLIGAGCMSVLAKWA